MIRLNQTASQLLSLITAQNGATVVVSYSDKSATGYDGNTQVTAITSATTTTVCNTPAAATIRDVDHIQVKNTYAGAHAVTVQLSSSATLYPLVTVTLATGDSLEFTHGSGWQVMDSNGQLKQTLVGGSMTSAQLAAIVSDETGSGALVFATSPTLVTPALGTPSSGTVTNLTGTASININGTVGATTPSTGAFTTLSSTGNTTLGDASTDTVTVNGYMGVGGAANAGRIISVTGTGTANDHTGVFSIATARSGQNTSDTTGVLGRCAIPDSAFTYTNAYGFYAGTNTKGASATLTNSYGLYINDQTVGTNSYGITSAVSSGANKWNIYASGTANNAFAGNVRIGGTTAPTVALDVTGAISATTTILSSGATSGIGYTTGAGGTVTQATSKSTGVTLNKVSGRITMNNASLAAGASVTFTLTNSAVTALDTIPCSILAASATSNIYVLTVMCAAGTAYIEVYNKSASAAAEAIQIQFNIIKGAAS